MAFQPIVSFGPNAADPHHEADSTRLEKGQCIVIDMGCRKDRYCSDMTRTYFCGEPSEKHAAIHDLVCRANALAESMVRPGVALKELDIAARSLIAEAGYGEYFTHRLGHFIGLRQGRGGLRRQRHHAADRPAGHDLLHRARRVPARRVRRTYRRSGAGHRRRLRDPQPCGQALETAPVKKTGTANRPDEQKTPKACRNGRPLAHGGISAGRGRFQLYYSRVSNAALKSAMMSSGSSRPTLMRTRPSEIPEAFSSSAV